mmetsp:Transcript_21153/g.59183  ORF Transcript_21153/g.59183 Transcript_21153/m.59183 type:complete len:224 (-) Transcript_21153:265-936(-)
MSFRPEATRGSTSVESLSPAIAHDVASGLCSSADARDDSTGLGLCSDGARVDGHEPGLCLSAALHGAAWASQNSNRDRTKEFFESGGTAERVAASRSLPFSRHATHNSASTRATALFSRCTWSISAESDSCSSFRLKSTAHDGCTSKLNGSPCRSAMSQRYSRAIWRCSFSRRRQARSSSDPSNKRSSPPASPSAPWHRRPSFESTCPGAGSSHDSAAVLNKG